MRTFADCPARDERGSQTRRRTPSHTDRHTAGLRLFATGRFREPWLPLAFLLALSACGDHPSDSSANDAGVGATSSAQMVVDPGLAVLQATSVGQPTSAGTQASGGSPTTPASNGSGSIVQTATVDVSKTNASMGTPATTTSSTSNTTSPSSPTVCPAVTPPASVAEILVASGQAVAVPPAFVGTHLSLHTPAWKPGGGGSIPAPAYPYGYVRTVSAEVGGLSERGFWSNIETAPGLYDWQYMDQWMAATAGHPVIWTVYGTPTFYQLYPGEPSRWPSWPGIASPPTTSGHQALTRYVSAVMARYSTRIAAIEVWNEPTLPWTGGVTSYDDRWSQSWGLANRPSMPMPFFSGSASDLANIAFSVRRANPGVPVIGAAFVDKWSPDKNTVERFMNAPVTLAGGSGRGGDQVDAMSVHFYDYSRRPLDMLDTLRGYRSKLAASAWPNLPIWVTEVGAEDGGRFTANEPAAGTAIVRWSVLAAALKTRSIVLYGHISAPNREQYLGDPVYGSNTIAALRDAARLNGATICQAAVLGDGRVWANLAGGTTLLR